MTYYNAMTILINSDGEYFLEFPVFEQDSVSRATTGPIEASRIGSVLTSIMTAEKDALIKYQLKNKLEEKQVYEVHVEDSP